MRLWLFTVGLLGLPGVAMGQQTDYTAGKTPAQLFSSDCSACHSSARGLSKGRDQRSLAGFLREHYTTKQETANALAAFLAGAPAAPEPRGRQVAPASGQQPATPAARVRPPGAAESEDTASAPESAAERRARQAREAREAAKPPQTPRSRKQDAAAAAEAARAAEEAEKEALRAKVRGYATTGEEARPKIAPTPAVAVPTPPAASDTESKTDASKAEAPAGEAPKAETPKAETAKPETPKPETSKAETPKADAPKAEAPKTGTASPAEGSKTSEPAKPGEENRSRSDAPAGSPPG